ncbi:MAG: metallophosphoesterase [Acidobacteriota bacterium]|nr:metallophosphoesterase [Acidobacteriota bacterium]
MPDYYSEPFLNLAGLTHKSALITWGAFYFRVRDSGKEFKLVDDDDLKNVHPPRSDSIGATSKPYGPATVTVSDLEGNVVASVSETEKNHRWVSGLEPDTEYTYSVTVKGEEWAGGPRRNWERVDGKMGLGPKSKSYRNRFRTFPDPTRPAPGPFTFAVIGDYGVGVKKDDDRGQRAVAAALERAVDEHDVRLVLTTGDNIYRSGGLLGLPIGGDTGDEDDDWYFTYYQPYRYVINRVPVYPTIGNHDAGETEERDDRTQLVDNFYINERIAGEEAAGRASVDPGLFYRFRFGSDVEFICIDTSKEPNVFDSKKRLFEHPKHQEFLAAALPAANGGSPAWRIPFCHHPPFCAGPKYGNTDKMGSLVEQFERAGVRLVLSGHEHNCQHSSRKGVDYIVTGGAGKIRTDKPKKFAEAHTVSWAAEYHFLLVTIDGKRMTVRTVGASDGGGQLVDITRKAPDGSPVTGPIVITLP